MSTNTIEEESATELAAQSLSERIGYVVGVDHEHYAHVYYPALDTIKVYDVGPDYSVGDYLDDDDICREDCLEGRPLSHWMDFVANRRGFKLTTHRAPGRF